MGRVPVLAAIAIVALALPAPLRAEPPPAEEPVRLYTNADLEKFGPPTGPDAPVRVPDAGEWRIVQEFLDREHARLDAERRYELDRAALEPEVAPDEGDRLRGYFPFYGWYGYPGMYPYGPRYRDHGVRGADRRRHGERSPGARARDDLERSSPWEPPRRGTLPARGPHPVHQPGRSAH